MEPTRNYGDRVRFVLLAVLASFLHRFRRYAECFYYLRISAGGPELTILIMNVLYKYMN